MQLRFALATTNFDDINSHSRAMAQLGSAFVWGTKGRGFESR